MEQKIIEKTVEILKLIQQDMYDIERRKK